MPCIPFFFLRHGQTDWNLAGLSQGSRDIPLNDTGLAQAQAAADVLAGQNITTIISSPMQRAHRTAQIVADRLGLSVTLAQDLFECSWGTREGTSYAGWLDAWHAGQTPPGAEPRADFFPRAANAVRRVLNTASAAGPVLIVAHGGVFWALEHALGFTVGPAVGHAHPLRIDPDPWRVTAL